MIREALPFTLHG